MTTPTPMTREELLELAALDALGLLDEYEAALFTRSFHHAPAGVQEEVKALQALYAADVSLLPAVEPPAGQKQRVLARVAKAVEAETVELAPLAIIGRRRTDRIGTVGRIGLGVSGQFYRAATFVLAGVVLVVLYFGSQNNERNDQIQSLAIDLLAQEQVAQVLHRERLGDIAGPDLLEFAGNPSCLQLTLRPAESVSSAHAVLFVNERTEQAFLFTFGLPEQVPLKLVSRSESGDEEFRHDFKVSSWVGGTAIASVSYSTARNMTWEVIDVAAGTVLLQYSV